MGTSAFAYDAAGNPTTFKIATQTFSADNQNTALGYDLDGNPTSWGTDALSFDTASHLTSVGTTLTAGYNAEGLRAWKQSSAGTTYFVYDGLTPIAEANSSGTVTAVNTWGAAGLLSRRSVSSGSSTFYTFDVQGSTAQRLDLNGNVLGSYTFDAYGTRASTDNSSDPYTGFGAQWGYYRDAETGLSLLGHRYYDPGQGRFLNRDPAGYGGGLNLYGYAANNPFMFVDPTGQDWQTVGGIAGGLIGFGLGGPMGAAIGAGIGGGLGSYFGDGRSGTRAFQDGVYSGALGGIAGGAAGLLGAGLRGGAALAGLAGMAGAGGEEEGVDNACQALSGAEPFEGPTDEFKSQAIAKAQAAGYYPADHQAPLDWDKVFDWYKRVQDPDFEWKPYGEQGPDELMEGSYNEDGTISVWNGQHRTIGGIMGGNPPPPTSMNIRSYPLPFPVAPKPWE